MTERGLKNINVFYSTFINVYFYFCHVFLRFFNVFYFFLERFFYIYAQNYQTVQQQLCHPNALQTFILTVHIDIDYCYFYYFLLYKLRF